MSKKAPFKSILMSAGLTEEDQKAFRHDLRQKFAKVLISAMRSNKRTLRKMADLPAKPGRWKVEAIELLEMLYTKKKEQVDDYLLKHPPGAEVIMLIIHFVHERAKSRTQHKGGSKRAEKYRPAQEFVVKAWLREKGKYKSKADFARIYARRVKTELEFDVTPRTIERAWLPRK